MEIMCIDGRRLSMIEGFGIVDAYESYVGGAWKWMLNVELVWGFCCGYVVECMAYIYPRNGI
jgi:hypothetical protein